MSRNQYHTEHGSLYISSNVSGLTQLDWTKPSGWSDSGFKEADSECYAEQVLTWLDCYFARERCADCRIDMHGLTSFARTVLETLRETVGWGDTITYAELAHRSGFENAARAVGTVMANNRWPLLIPCHRVLPANGRIGAYSGGCGPQTKRWLLEHEGHMLSESGEVISR
jgi:methylated-DNA-[protein]-cysteine S-methyltransferase